MATQTLTNAITTNPVTGANIYTSGLAPDSSLNSVYNTGTNAGGSTDKSLTNNYSVSGSTPDTGNAIASNLNAGFAPTQNTIMQNYEAANQALSNQAATTAKSLTDTGQYNLGYENTQNKNLLTQQQESQRGAAVNPGAIVSLQVQADKRVRDLTTQMNDALANNNSQLASSLAQNVAAEQNAITNARTVFLSQYFQSQTESRAQASFQTPEQKSVLDLASTYPNAGIVPGDSLSAAQAKVSGSAQYQLTQKATQANITASLAAAGLSSAQASQVNTILDTLKNTGQYQSDVAGLINGSTTDQTLHSKYDAYPSGLGGAIVAQIESEAQTQGWNPQQAGLKSAAQISQNAALNSGNPFTLFGSLGTQVLGAAGSALGGVGSTLNNTISGMKNLNTSPVAGTDGTAFGFPGYISNGTAWVKKK